MEARARNPRGEGERLRDGLLDAATELLAELHDVDAMSVRAVTRRAGVSPTALYLHFADKDELVVATKQRCFAALRDRLDDAADGAVDPWARLTAMGAAYLAFAREQPGWYAVCFHTRFRGFELETCVAGADDVPMPQRPGEDEDAPGMDVFFRLVAAVAAAGVGDEGSAVLVATILWSALHGRAALERAMPDFPLPGEGAWLDRLSDVVRGARDDGRSASDQRATAEAPGPGRAMR
ncbi:MAG: WHG domain-containing protein [Solirubrobacteraceae bacterium]|nr:WHG domain-containing protein [Solirubrobacteraceae bacterium]